MKTLKDIDPAAQVAYDGMNTEFDLARKLITTSGASGMTRSDVSYEQATAQALTDPKEAAVYIEAAVELDGPAAFLMALRTVVGAHGLAEVALRAGVDEKTLWLDLSENGNATWNTVQKVLHAVGLRLSVLPTSTR